MSDDQGPIQRKSKRPRKAGRGPRGLGGFFLRGLITLLPVVLTLVVFGLLFQMIDRYVTGPINDVIYWSLERNAVGWQALEKLGIDPLARDYVQEDLLPADLREMAKQRGLGDKYVQEQIAGYREGYLDVVRDLDKLAIHSSKLRTDVARVVHPIFGILSSLLVVLWLGWLVGSFVGRRLVARLDKTMHLIPIVKSVYPYSKQLVEFFFAEKKLEFDSVVCVPYPSPGLWSLGFVTGNSIRSLREQTSKEYITCFVPSSPMPMTGYTIFVEASRVIPLSISVDEALRVTMTGGVIVPPSELVKDGGEFVLPKAPLMNVDPLDSERDADDSDQDDD